MRRVLSLAGGVALASCLDPTQATIVITTNVDCGPEQAAAGTLFQTGVSATGSRTTSADTLTTTTPSCTPRESGIHDIGDVVIFPEGGATEGSVVVVGALDVGVEAEDCLALARGEGDPLKRESCIIARRTVPFADHTMLRVPILLDRFCAGLVCDEDTTCVSEGGGPRCVDNRVTCRGSGCEIEGSGGAAQGGGGAGAGGAGAGGAGAGGAGAGGSGGGTGTLDCSATQPLHLATSGEPVLNAIVGVEGYDPTGPIIFATGFHRQVTNVYEVRRTLMFIRPLPSEALSMDAALMGPTVVVAVAEQFAAGFFDLTGMMSNVNGPGALDVVVVPSDQAAYLVDGSPKLDRLSFTDFDTATSFLVFGAPPNLTAVAASSDRVFAVGSHVCRYDVGGSGSCGQALTEPWVDAWAASTTQLVGLGADFVDVTDEAGNLAGPHDLLPVSIPGTVSLRKVKGAESGAFQRFFVAGASTDANGTVGYIALGVFDGATITWSECRLPGTGGLVDLWVNAAGTDAYFVSDDGAAHLLTTPP